MAAAIGRIGPAYVLYQQAFIDNGIDGTMLAEWRGQSEEDTLRTLIADLCNRVQPARSKRVLLELKKMCPPACTSRGKVCVARACAMSSGLQPLLFRRLTREPPQNPRRNRPVQLQHALMYIKYCFHTNKTGIYHVRMHPRVELRKPGTTPTLTLA